MILSSFYFIRLPSKGSVLVSFGLVVLLTVFKNVTALLKGTRAVAAVLYPFAFDADEIIPVNTVFIARIHRYRSIKGIVEAA